MRRARVTGVVPLAVFAAGCVFPPIELDGLACDERRPCIEGTCVDGTCRGLFVCTSDADCDDDEACALGACRPRRDAGPAALDGGGLDDAGDDDEDAGADSGAPADAGTEDAGPGDAGQGDAGTAIVDAGALPEDAGCADLDPFGADVDGDCVPDLLVGSPGPIAVAQIFLGLRAGGFAFQQQLQPTVPGGMLGTAIAIEPVPVFDDAGARSFSVGEPGPADGGLGVVHYYLPSDIGYARFSYVGEAGAHLGASVAFGADTFGPVLFAGAPGTGYLRAIRPGTMGNMSTLDVFPDDLGGASSPGAFAASLARLLDVNGDGIDDLGVSAVDTIVDGGPAGAWLVSMGTDLPRKVGGASAAVPGGEFGSAIAAAADIDDDGTPDLLYGAPTEGTGAVYVAASSRAGIFVRIAPAPAAPMRFGASIATLGDLDGDGLDEIAIGAPFAAGSVFVLDGCRDVPGAPAAYGGDCAGALYVVRGVDLAAAAALPFPGTVAPACAVTGDIGAVVGVALRALGPTPAIGPARIALGAPGLPSEAGAVVIVLANVTADACTLAPIGRLERAGGALVGDRFGAALGQ